MRTMMIRSTRRYVSYGIMRLLNAKCKMQNVKRNAGRRSQVAGRRSQISYHAVTVSPCHRVTVSLVTCHTRLDDRLLATHVEDVDTLIIDVEPDLAPGRHVERRRCADLDDRIADPQVEDRAIAERLDRVHLGRD